MVDVICTPPCAEREPIVMRQEGVPTIPGIWPPAPDPSDTSSLDFTDPDNSQYVGQVV